MGAGSASSGGGPLRSPAGSEHEQPTKEYPNGFAPGQPSRGGGRDGSDRREPPKRWPGQLVAFLSGAILVFLLMKACGEDRVEFATPDGNAITPSSFFRMMSSVRVKQPPYARKARTMEAQTSTVVRSVSPIEETVHCSPADEGKTTMVVVFPWEIRQIGKGTTPDLVRDLCTSELVKALVGLPDGCTDEVNKKIDWRDIARKKIPDACSALIKAALDKDRECNPPKDKHGSGTSGHRTTDVSRGMGVVDMRCERSACPAYSQFRGDKDTDIVGWDNHVRAQGQLVGDWCKECPGLDCAVECQVSATAAGFDRNDLARFQDACRTAARPREEKR